MYGVPYELSNAKELLAMTALARFYGALPVLSRSLLAPLLRSESFVYSMESSTLQLVVAAKELRHVELFKDCLLLSVGPWNKRYGITEQKFEDPLLTQLVSSVLSKITLMVCNAQHALVSAMAGLDAAGYDGNMEEALQSKVTDIAKDVASEHQSTACLPCFYRDLYNADLGCEDSELKEDFLEPLLADNLFLANFHGVEDFEHHFT